MGDPKKQHRHYDSVKRPWDKDRILEEKKIVQKYGIRRKKELRKAETILRNLRQRARTLIGTRNDKEESILLKKIYEQGLADKDATIDTILGLKIEAVLERRLQTILLKQKLANKPLQSRQFVTHGHITVDGIKAISPSYLVKIHEENKISYNAKSSLNSTFKPVEKEEPKTKTAPKDEKKEKEPKKQEKDSKAKKDKDDSTKKEQKPKEVKEEPKTKKPPAKKEQETKDKKTTKKTTKKETKEKK